MSTLQQSTTPENVLASLYIQALRQGQSLWFRVASESMNPILKTGDSVGIMPANANEIQQGEIAAFETARGLVIHRIIHIQRTQTSVRLLQMGDYDLYGSWVKEEAIVGRVVKIRRDTLEIDLQLPIARWCSAVTARSRYLLYLLYKRKHFKFARVVLRKCARLFVHTCSRILHSNCSSVAMSPLPQD